MSWKEFTNGPVADATEIQTHLMRQVVARFATAGARDAAIIAPEQGMVVDVAGVGITRYSGSAWVTVVVSGTSAAWTTASLGTGFANYGGSYSDARYRKLANGVVLLGGLVKTTLATVTAGSTIFTLPAGFRPGVALILPAYRSDGNVTRINYGSGDITTGVAITGAGTFISLDGITFLAEA